MADVSATRELLLMAEGRIRNIASATWAMRTRPDDYPATPELLEAIARLADRAHLDVAMLEVELEVA